MKEDAFEILFYSSTPGEDFGITRKGVDVNSRSLYEIDALGQYNEIELLALAQRIQERFAGYNRPAEVEGILSEQAKRKKQSEEADGQNEVRYGTDDPIEPIFSQAEADAAAQQTQHDADIHRFRESLQELSKPTQGQLPPGEIAREQKLAIAGVPRHLRKPKQ